MATGYLRLYDNTTGKSAKILPMGPITTDVVYNLPLKATGDTLAFMTDISELNNTLLGISDSIPYKTACVVGTTTNITLNNVQTIDGISVNIGDRVLVKDQSDTTTNGIYIVSNGNWTRAQDADTGNKIASSIVPISIGIVNGNTTWSCTVSNISLGNTHITYNKTSTGGILSLPSVALNALTNALNDIGSLNGSDGLIHIKEDGGIDLTAISPAIINMLTLPSASAVLASIGAAPAVTTYSISQIDAMIQGISIKGTCLVATTGSNITLTGSQTIDGVSVNQGTRVLVKDQSDTTTNGIYIVSNGNWTRATDADIGSELEGSFVMVESGIVNNGTGWACSSTNITLGITGIIFTPKLGGNLYMTQSSFTSAFIASVLGYTPYNASNPSGFISGNQNITVTGDVTGTGNTSIRLTLSNTGVSSGTYGSGTVIPVITVGNDGRVTSISTTQAAAAPTVIDGGDSTTIFE